MSRYGNTRKSKKDRSGEPTADLLAHIQFLGLSTVKVYLAWCAQHGFSRRTEKHPRLRLKERSFANQAIADARLAQKKQEQRKPRNIIERIFQGELLEEHVTQPYLKTICRAYKSAQESPQTRGALHDLLQHVSTCTDLLNDQSVIREFGNHAGNTFIDGLVSLAANSKYWMRPVTAWKPLSHNSRRQFNSLARHLFAKWPVPAFMDSAWFFGSGAEAFRRQRWFIHVATGQNIRTTDLPLLYTKRMAHFFMQAPDDFTIDAALRWGQILALGGSERLVRAVICTRLGTSFEHDDFWATVLKFFVANPLLDLAQVGPIIDFIYHQRFVPEEVFVALGTLEPREPLQPNLSMSGRTASALLRQVRAWHRSLAKTEQRNADWRPAGINAFEFVEGHKQEGTLKVWRITELLSTEALINEGRKLKHCVASYARSCARGISSIWSLEVETLEGRSKILTIEVYNQAKLICQARGKCNALATEKQRGILRRWAVQTGLTLSQSV